MKGFFSALCITMMTAGTLSAADSLMVVEGGTLFKQLCTSCHALEQRLVGPALIGVDKRHDEDWLLKFIPSTQSMVLAGDSAAVSLFNIYNKVVMPDHNLTSDQIRSILAYIKDAETVRSVPSGSIPRPVVAMSSAQVRPLKFSDYRFWILYTITILLVIVSIYYKAELIALGKTVNHSAEE